MNDFFKVSQNLTLGILNGNPLQYSCLENPMDRGAWQVTVLGVAKSWTRLSDFTFTFLSDSKLCVTLYHSFFFFNLKGTNIKSVSFFTQIGDSQRKRNSSIDICRASKMNQALCYVPGHSPYFQESNSFERQKKKVVMCYM